jgi:flagellar biosynthesis/type III secretory pathway M-ring protein FliF/YscJ
MLKRLLAAMLPSAPEPVRRVARPRKAVKTLAELEAEIQAELDAEGAASAPEAERRSQIRQRVQASTASDAETMAALIRAWILEDRK